MTCVCVCNTKGGVGKTTTAIHIAMSLFKSNSVLLIDGDEQKSASKWAMYRREHHDCLETPTTICLTNKSIFLEGRGLEKHYSYVVVDVGGRDTSSLRSGLVLADIAVIPCGASSLDYMALTDLLEVIAVAKEHNPDLIIKILMTRLDPRSKDNSNLLAFLIENNLSVFNTIIHERVSYRRSIAKGLVVQEYEHDLNAILEIENLMKEILVS